MGSISDIAGSISNPTTGSISKDAGSISYPSTGTISTDGGSTPPVDPSANLYLRTITEKGDTVPENLYLRTIEEKEG